MWKPVKDANLSNLIALRKKNKKERKKQKLKAKLKDESPEKGISNLIPKLDNPSNGYLIYPTVIFILFSITSMVLSVIATRPNVTRGEFTRDDVKNKKVNLLFFGNFHKMKLEDYEWAIGEMLQDKEYIYSALTKDLYFLGLVLDRKYKLLRITYNVFMIGIIVSVIAFGVFFQFQGRGEEVPDPVAMTSIVATLF